MKYYRILFVCLALLATHSYAEDSSDERIEKTQQLLEKMQQQIKGTLQAISEEEKRAGRDMKDFHFSIEIPAKNTVNFGAVLDISHPEKGFEVLTVTPGGLASTKDISPGDHILAVDTIYISSETSKQAIERLLALEINSTFNLTVKKKDTNYHMAFSVSGEYSPSIKLEIGANSIKQEKSEHLVELQQSDSSCGEVSVFFTPPSTKNIYSLKITKIDDKKVIQGRKSFNLSVGKHLVYVRETIPYRELLQRRPKDNGKAKILEINIEKNKTYHLGAQLDRNNKSRLYNEAYWRPVIWQIKDVKWECTL